VQLINTQGRRDGTTGMMIDETESFSPGAGIAANLRGRGQHTETSAPAAADFGSDSRLSGYPGLPASPGGLIGAIPSAPAVRSGPWGEPHPNARLSSARRRSAFPAAPAGPAGF
jgi:hypothetical protein